MKTEDAKVIIPNNLAVPPEPHEIEAAWIIALHYHQTIEFLKPVDDYKRKTPDFIMGGAEWEMKAPEGNSKTTIGRILQRASWQSKNIVVDCRRTTLPEEVIRRTLLFELGKRQQIKKLILITKDKKVLELQWHT